MCYLVFTACLLCHSFFSLNYFEQIKMDPQVLYTHLAMPYHLVC